MISPADILQVSILIVDDQQANVVLLEQMLSEAGFAQFNPNPVGDRRSDLL
jgi:CheY-like chemotaxis protein